jgi:hypothetical protein
MTTTYVPLYTTTVATATPSITISSIPPTYTDLVLVCSVLTTTTSASVNIQFNADTASNYSYTVLDGNGSAVQANRQSNTTAIQLAAWSSNLGSTTALSPIICNINNYSNSTTNKTVLTRSTAYGASSVSIDAFVGLWRSNAAITSLQINSSNFAVGTTVSLYGVASALIGAKAAGGSIYSDDTYWYHIFGSSGTFTPSQSLSADYLVVAGGGGGATGGSNSAGGGGGAGGLRTSAGPSGGGASAESALSLSSGVAYTVTVGAGGNAGDQGSSSSIAGSGLTTISTVGGGFGKGYGVNQVGGSGGSGGGGYNGTGGVGGAGTANQGYAGGSSTASGAIAGAGGGAGAVGGNASATVGGIGGIGVLSSMAVGVPTYFAGGGGGIVSGDSNFAPATGGLGGGGNGGDARTTGAGQNGAANTGGGGGGNIGASPTTGKGGSGIVIIRYPKV